ncbi:MAG: hypothetical protein JNK64_22550 [Myxococcales bacterium]|nr:hypothetical protein [Myxococcales bacterium]
MGSPRVGHSHRDHYPFRIAGSVSTAATMAAHELTSQASISVAWFALVLAAPHVAYLLRGLMPSNDAAKRIIVVDALVVTGVALATHLPPIGLLVGITLVNALASASVRVFAAAVAASAIMVAIGHGELAATVAVGFLLWPSLTVGVAVLAYMLSLATFVRGAGQRLAAARRELQLANAGLEQRVAERTAALASTNAAIQRFVPREFLHALGHDDVTTAKLGDAAARTVTVLFADLRNFTSASEGLTPEETFAYLNDCLSRLGPLVRAHAGFVDKYIGDAIMALFPRAPRDAVMAAIAMHAELRAGRAPRPDRPPPAIGVGVHVGEVMMGTIGEVERFEATVISDVVNLTARLESLTKQLGCAILISEDVWRTLDEEVRADARRLGTFVVKGKVRPVSLYEVFAADPPALREAKRRGRARFEAMLDAFAHDRVDEARALARALRDEAPDDGAASWWARRLAAGGAVADIDLSSRGIVKLDAK